MQIDAAAERGILEAAFEEALRAAAPGPCLAAALGARESRGPALVLGAGKAAAAMAAALHGRWQAPVRGMVVTRYEHGLKPGESAGSVEVVEAGHPMPDGASLAAGARLLEFAGGIRSGETLVFLVSGGGSALASAPLGPVSFEHKRDVAMFLMNGGADIREINCVRKHLSGLKGGRLAAAAHPAPVLTYAISDVPGDNVADIASGPTIPDPGTQDEARRILDKYAYPNRRLLEPVLSNPAYETPKPGDARFAADEAHVIATAATALAAARRYLDSLGFEVLCLGDDLADEAASLGRAHARLAIEQSRHGRRLAILSGGETRVVLGKTGGRGGRNLEYLSGLALELADRPGIYALAADTDGIDGHGGHAGGIVVPGMLERGAERARPLDALLDDHDTYRFFDACGLLLETGPTRTNVNDFRLILCNP